MPIDANDINQYIFDPKNPKQCISYKLLLNIAKEKNLVFIDSDFTAYMYTDDIINNSFMDKLWKIPENFKNFNIREKIKLFKETLSEKEYIEHINNLKIDEDRFIYNNIFSKFIDIHTNGVHISNKLQKYDSYLIKSKLLYTSDYSYEGYKKYKDNYTFTSSYHGHKILFSNNLEILLKSDSFYDVSSVVITTLNSANFTQKGNSKHFISNNINPIILEKIEDVKLLLHILQNDLKKEKSTAVNKKEKISIINNIKIKNFFSIKNLELNNLKDKKEIYILGENGDGKTLLLQAIAIALKGSDEDGLKEFRDISSNFTLAIKNSAKNVYDGSGKKIYKNMLAYGANRNNVCLQKEDETGYLSLFNSSIDLQDPIKWLQVLDYSEAKGENNNISLEQAKTLIKHLLNDDVEIDMKSSEEVLFIEKGSAVDFNRLSAGYKGVITIVCDMLIRLSNNQPYITDIVEYQGIVLIDEVELHLHPKWKYDFMKKLRELFPLIQFIVTTHSPTVILGASKEAVFYKIYKECGEVCISNQMKNEGYTNNSLVSSPLFDLKNITSRNYEKKVNSDDYIYDKIHQVISKRIEENINIKEEEILNLIDEELNKI